MAVIRNRFKELLAERERKEGRVIEYSEVQRETGVNTATLSAYATQKVSRFDSKTVVALCDYFGCELSEMLVIERPNPNPGQGFSAAVSMAA